MLAGRHTDTVVDSRCLDYTVAEGGWLEAVTAEGYWVRQRWLDGTKWLSRLSLWRDRCCHCSGSLKPASYPNGEGWVGVWPKEIAYSDWKKGWVGVWAEEIAYSDWKLVLQYDILLSACSDWKLVLQYDILLSAYSDWKLVLQYDILLSACIWTSVDHYAGQQPANTKAPYFSVKTWLYIDWWSLI